jgi:hypothetical protein
MRSKKNLRCHASSEIQNVDLLDAKTSERIPATAEGLNEAIEQFKLRMVA